MIVGMRNSKYKQVQFLADNLRRENKIRKGIKYSLESNVKERIHQKYYWGLGERSNRID